MKIAVCSITHHSVHSPMHVGRHILDWQLQTDNRYFLSVVHDGQAPADWDCSIDDYISGAGIDHSKYRISYCQTQRRFWGAYNRKDWLEALDPEEYPWCFNLCVDDMPIPMLVETVFRELAPEIQMLGFNVSHHHYGHRPIPGGTWPTLSRCDWSSFVVKTELAKKVGITDPEEYACDGIFLSACFAALEHDTSKMKILDNFLVVKN